VGVHFCRGIYSDMHQHSRCVAPVQPAKLRNRRLRGSRGSGNAPSQPYYLGYANQNHQALFVPFTVVGQYGRSNECSYSEKPWKLTFLARLTGFGVDMWTMDSDTISTALKV
jgi:hypothetical protein